MVIIALENVQKKHIAYVFPNSKKMTPLCFLKQVSMLYSCGILLLPKQAPAKQILSNVNNCGVSRLFIYLVRNERNILSIAANEALG
mmetsp:Transcript_4081/g.6392  ORF Transcript_4081/g.6392 Transcript_4081/m.6392 type:complete len:87 (-) Transcript_4081:156-416(-)